ncbi:MAG TPA: isoamylase early set domain-containing protein [Rhodothermales bacterium]|nr:isoamylase early set domain-containing protein [Rhodothermales bacterium]
MIDKQANGKSVKVTFELPADVAENGVAVVGDFNDWSNSKHKMKLDKKRSVWTKTISLKPGQTYQFRYLVDENNWRNDERADRYEPSPYFSENGVIEL